MADAKRDSNSVSTLLGVSSADGVTPVLLYADPTTHRLLTDATAGMSNPMTTGGDLIYGGVAGTPTRLANGNVGQVLTSQGTTLAPIWSSAGAGDMILASVQTVTGAKTFNDTKLILAGAGAGVATFSYTNSASNATITFPATTGTVALTSQLTSGTVTATGGALTANAVVLGAGTTDTKVSTGITTNGIAQLVLGVNTTTLGTVKMFGNTSGDVTIQPTAVAGTATTQTLPATTGTLVNRVTTGNGVSATNTDGALAFTLGAITPSTVNGNTITTGTGTLTMAAGKTLTVNGNTTLGLGGITLDNSGGVTITASKVLTVSNTLTLAGTDSTTMTFPATSKTIAANDGSNWTITSQAIGDILTATSTTAYGRVAAVATGSVLVSQGTGTAPAYSANPQVTTIELGAATDTTISRVSAGVIAVEGVTVDTISATNTLTNKRINKRIVSTTSYTTDTGTSLDVATCDQFVVTAQAGALKFNNPSGTPTEGQHLIIRIKDNGTARALTYDTQFRAMGNALPSTTVLSKTLYMGFIYNNTDTKWDLVAVAQEA